MKIQIKILFLVFTFASLAAQAQYSGAISSATAGSGRAAVEATDSPFLNPATIPFLRGYYFTSSFNSTSVKTSDMALTLTDNMKETVMPTSLGYIQHKEENKKSQDFRLAFGQRFLKKAAAGLAIHHRNDQNLENSHSQTNLTLAGAIGSGDNFSVGFVADDVLPSSGSVPQDVRLESQSSIGVAYNYKRVVRGKLDLLTGMNNKYTRPTLLGGVETFFNKWLIVRVGAGRDSDLNANILSAGFGFQLPKFGIHYGYLQESTEVAIIRHTVDLAIPVW